MSNPYLASLRERYDGLREGIAGLQTRAAEEKRDLTEDELRSITEQAEQAKALATQIEDLTEIETRNRKVAELGAQLLTTTTGQDGQDGEDTTQSRSLGAARTQDRDPGHYTRSSQHSFFGDLYRSRVFGDEVSSRRLHEHTRALDTGTEGVGVVPPRWMTDEFETLARQGRALANAVRNIPLGDDPRPITLPKQTAGTDNVVAEQANENDPVDGTDAWDSDVDLVAPKPTAGKQTVSRQMLDMSSPAIDMLIYGDLMSVYNLKVEQKVGGAVIAAAGAPVTAFATEAEFAADAAAIDAVIDTSIAVRNARKLGANVVAMTVNRWGKFKKLKDANNRPLIPVSTYGPQNVAGIGSVNVDGVIEDLAAVATDAIGDGVTYPESVVALRSTDTLLFESNLLRFRFEEQAGPESVVLGIWGYTAVIVRQAGKSVKRFQITAASV
ncbi:HK97 family phage major capsid protein [Prauserella shujinwangii]|uniref:HK97 family phage major capsid protein n=1 Tax=Prauserella shujinwangii TaxID=1453103 RepID=A0A2T0LXJ4_9PSEU|nr:phage major capsid protein [Prauserella shujinwangii]PRX48679.1 HK97 family phage major capsid protein [Prauserella shujinwangii]